MTTNEFKHIPVLSQQVLEALQPRSGGIYVDGTVGGGGHAALVLEAGAPNAFLLGIDRDAEARAAAAAHLAPYAGRFKLLAGNYCDMADLLAEQGIEAVDGILLDIGVSSHQLDAAERGFSYMQDAALDMRMDQSCGRTAAELVNEASGEELKEILYRYGEEKWAARIVQMILEARARQPITRTGELVDIIKKAIPKGAREKDQHPAKRSFQAIRIAVNDELGALERGLEAAIGLLRPGGVLGVISFHSLEDRIVKEVFRLHSRDCICPPGLPVCQCGHKADVKLLNKKPLVASPEELAINPRSRSANFRAVRKL
ncbi:MAG: 16S rRNA (cytosine(1402)-N(4))-methyltransferase RsmH [Bacillota bacterium]|nr:16S rRNA (cytosine(1402)-N(4))-methyltransferase RsmH [Bacillota bacterium]